MVRKYLKLCITVTSHAMPLTVTIKLADKLNPYVFLQQNRTHVLSNLNKPAFYGCQYRPICLNTDGLYNNKRDTSRWLDYVFA